MDNMLYIIAGLVIFLLIAVLVKRRRTAQKPSTSANKSPITSVETIKPRPEVERSNSKQRATTTTSVAAVTKFDSITVAERFIEQQRYDKAIETLDRGLEQKPNSSSLLLKLLEVYIVADRLQDFDRVYSTIQAHGDQDAIEKAQQLKKLVNDEYSNPIDSAISRNMRLETDSIIDEFSGSTPVTETEPLSSSVDLQVQMAADDITNPLTSDDRLDIGNDNFDLVLSDLKAFTTDTPDNITDSLNLTDTNDDGLLQIEPVITTISSSNITNIDDDFVLSFDDITDDLSEDNAANKPFNDFDDKTSSNELNLNDDFVLDLAADFIVSDNDTATDSVLANSSPSANNQNDIEGFVLSLDDEDSLDSFDIPSQDKSVNQINAKAASFESDLFSFDFANDAVDDKVVDAKVADTDSTEINDDDDFEDTILIDDNFNFNDFEVDHAKTSTAPVALDDSLAITSKNAAKEAPVDFDAQFTADFDFVKDLDSNQVTLDLADQYLQLGEYDSAKRLLNEVITHGNDEQQQKARELLTRTV